MLGSSIDWTNVLVAVIAGLPAIIAAVFAGLIHAQVRTPSGKSLGALAGAARDAGIANNLLLSKGNGPTHPADRSELEHAAEVPPQVPSEEPKA